MADSGSRQHRGDEAEQENAGGDQAKARGPAYHIHCFGKKVDRSHRSVTQHVPAPEKEFSPPRPVARAGAGLQRWPNHGLSRTIAEILGKQFSILAHDDRRKNMRRAAQGGEGGFGSLLIVEYKSCNAVGAYNGRLGAEVADEALPR